MGIFWINKMPNPHRVGEVLFIRSGGTRQKRRAPPLYDGHTPAQGLLFVTDYRHVYGPDSRTLENPRTISVKYSF